MHQIHITVRFGETDALGHINNASYFVYLEEARIRFFETLGYKMDAGHWNFILASTKCDFINQGYFNQTLTVKTYVSRIGTKSFQLEHEIIDSRTHDLIAKANGVMVYFDFDRQTSEVLPEELRESLMNYMVYS